MRLSSHLMNASQIKIRARYTYGCDSAPWSSTLHGGFSAMHAGRYHAPEAGGGAKLGRRYWMIISQEICKPFLYSCCVSSHLQFVILAHFAFSTHSWLTGCPMDWIADPTLFSGTESLESQASNINQQEPAPTHHQGVSSPASSLTAKRRHRFFVSEIVCTAQRAMHCILHL